MSINRWIGSGNLTRDPELRVTGSGMQVLKFGLAVNDRRKNSNGEWEDVPNFVDITVFGNRAESLAKFLAKGMKVTVEGKLRWSQWQTDGGEKRSKLEIVADDVELPPRGSQSSADSEPITDEDMDSVPF
jgi:single-strand DNA-binding protein